MKKLLKNVITSALPQIINIISNLILPGFIILKFGSEINGLVSTTKTVVSYISLVGAGIATAVTQALYSPVANNDNKAVKGMLRSANDMFNRYGLIYLALTLVISFIYPIIIRSEISYVTIMLLLIVMSISGASEFFAIGRCRALLYAHQKVYVCSIIQALSLLLSLILAVLMLKLGAGIIIVQFTISFVYILRGIFLTGYIRKEYPMYSDYKSEEPIQAAVKNKKEAMIHQLAGLVVTGSQSAILTLLVDLKAASIYSVYNIVLYGIRCICSNVFTAITPFLGKKFALNQIADLNRVYNLAELLFFYFVNFILIVTTIMILPFVNLYTNDADINYLFPTFAILFILSSQFYILKLPGNALINVAGHFKETKVRALIEAGLSLVLSVLFTISLGMEGVLIGTGIALAWRCIDTIIYSARYILKISAKKSIFRIFLATINILIAKNISKVFIFECKTWLDWVKFSSVFSVVALMLLFLEVLVFERKGLFDLITYIKKERKVKGR